MERSKKTEFRVGVFVLSALLLIGALTAVIGNQRGFFSRTMTYRALFDSVGGLRPGCPVRVGGVAVGTVDDVVLRADGKILVVMDVVRDAARLVRVGSVASIGAKGLLGDKLVDISVGHGAPLAEGATLPAESPVDIGQYMADAGRILARARETVENLSAATGTLQDPEFRRNLSSAVANLSRISELAANGNGVANRLLTDPRLADDLVRVVDNANTATLAVAAAATDASAIVREVQSGDGTAHELVYGQSGRQLAENLAAATGEAVELLRATRTGDGIAHEFVYEQRGGRIVENLASITSDVRAMVADVRAGRGTLGGFVVDPSIYEDVKRLVGNIERNTILRALVRYSISRSDERETPTVQPVPTDRTPTPEPAQ